MLLSAAPWDTWAADLVGRIPFDHPAELSAVADQVKAGACTAHRLSLDGAPVGVLVTRCETWAGGRELVVIAAAVRNSREPLAPVVAEAADVLARRENCATVRFHTSRPGVAATAARFGYHLTELIFRKAVHHG